MLLAARPAAAQPAPCLCGTYTQIDRTSEDHPGACDPTTYTCFNNGQCYQGDVCIEGICVAAGTPHKTNFYATQFCCDDGHVVFASQVVHSQSACGEGASRLGQVLAYDCRTECYLPDETQCDGRDNDGDHIADEGCREEPCADADQDEHPVRFSSGRVETNPITPFSLAAPSELFFGVQIRWGSHSGHRAGPLFDNNGAIDFYGSGMLDVFGDRLLVAEPVASPDPFPASITWESFSQAARFTRTSLTSGEARYVTDDGAYTLVATASSYRVTGTRDHVERTFRALTYTVPVGPTRRGILGVLTELRAGGYAIALTRDVATGRLQSVTDSFGRTLTYEHEVTTSYARVRAVRYVAPGQSPIVVARFVYADDPLVLSRVERGAGGYTRMRIVPVSLCTDCRGLVAEVIEQVRDGAPGDAYAPVAAHERVVEGHDWDLSHPGRRPVARGSYGPRRRWAYRAENEATCAQTGVCHTQQIDLQAGTGATCSADASCGAGHACWEGACYEVTTIAFDHEARRVRSVSTPDGEGDFDLVYDALGRLASRTDAMGVRTTFSYDATGEIACHVIDDDDDDAGVAPACDAPPGAWVRSVTRNGLVEVERSPGTLPGSAGRTVTTARDALGHVVRVTTTGETLDIEGGRVTQTITEHRIWDAFGRLSEVVRVDEPGFRDRTIYTYNAVNAGFGAGLLYQSVEEIGPPSSPRRKVTTYSGYDAWGEPHTVSDPDGIVTTRSFSADRRITSTTSFAGGLPQESSTETRNFDGSPYIVVDADGVCTTFEERADARIAQRSRAGSATCGTLPIDVNREHVAIERTTGARPTDVTGRAALYFGTVLEDAEFGVDRHGRPTQVFVDGVLVETRTHGVDGSLETLEGTCPGPRCIRTRSTTDAMLRTRSVERTREDGHVLTTAFVLRGGLMVPDAITRGLDGDDSLRSDFLLDDFGRTVEVTTADSAKTRTAYAADDRVELERVGVDGVAESTTQTLYDVLRRPVRIDHDLEHPVDCAAASTGTPLADVELVYDACPGAPSGFVCSNAQNRVAVERSQLACEAGVVFSRAEYFAYDTRGRVIAQAVAFERGATVVEWLAATHVVTVGGAYATVGNPAGTGLGTTLTPSTANLVSSSLSTSEPYTLGYLDQMRLGAPLTGAYFGGRFLVSASFDHRGLPATRSFHDWGTGRAHLDAFYTYDAAGRQTEREDTSATGTAGASRFLARDAIGRLTCEDPDDAGCVGALARATYTDETIDQRTTQAVSTPWFPHTTAALSATHALAYEPSTSRLVSAASTADTITLEHDARGRRIAERHTSASSKDRTYTYLPSGRLATVRGQRGGVPYTLTLSYDARNRPVRVVETPSGATDDFFYGPTGELVGARRSGVDAPMAGLARFDDGAFLSVFSDDTWSLGNTADLAATAPRQPVALPSFGGSAAEVVAIATASNTRSLVVYFAAGYAWTGNVTESAGRLTFTWTNWFTYTLAPGQSPETLVDIERDPQNGRFTAWYTNGTYSQGTMTALAAVSSNTPYTTQLPVAGVALKLGALNSKGVRLPSVAYAFHDGGVLLTGTTPRFDSSFAQLPAPVGANGPQRLGFHRVAGELVAVTRRTEQRTQHLYVVSDEQGVPQRVLDERGIVLADVHTSAFGLTSRRVKPSVWLPLALPGQIPLEQTRTPSMPPLALNGARTYDPWSGRFLEPDPFDVLPREDPEGYVLARNDPTHYGDPSGTMSFHASCTLAQRQLTYRYGLAAIADIRARCTGLLCKEDIQRWVSAIMHARYACVGDDQPIHLAGGATEIMPGYAIAAAWPRRNLINLPPLRFEDPDHLYEDPHAGCLKRIIAHEGRHLSNPNESHELLHRLDRCTNCP